MVPPDGGFQVSSKVPPNASPCQRPASHATSSTVGAPASAAHAGSATTATITTMSFRMSRFYGHAPDQFT